MRERKRRKWGGREREGQNGKRINTINLEGILGVWLFKPKEVISSPKNKLRFS